MYEWYGIMPNKILFDNTLSDKSKLLFCLISSLSAEKWYCRATNEYMAEKLWVKSRIISERVRELQQHWYIIIEIENKCKRNIWIIRDAKICDEDSKKLQGEDSKKLQHNITSSKSTKEKELEELKNKLEIEYQLPQSVIELTLVFDQYKAWPKIRKFDKGQLTRRVNKLKKDGLDCEEGMLMTLEKSIASWYQWTTPIRERELKKKEEKPNTLAYH